MGQVQSSNDSPGNRVKKTKWARGAILDRLEKAKTKTAPAFQTRRALSRTYRSPAKCVHLRAGRVARATGAAAPRRRHGPRSGALFSGRSARRFVFNSARRAYLRTVSFVTAHASPWRRDGSRAAPVSQFAPMKNKRRIDQS